MDFNVVLPPPINMIVNAVRTVANGTFEVSLTAFNSASKDLSFRLAAGFSDSAIIITSTMLVIVLARQGNS